MGLLLAKEGFKWGSEKSSSSNCTFQIQKNPNSPLQVMSERDTGDLKCTGIVRGAGTAFQTPGLRGHLKGLMNHLPPAMTQVTPQKLKETTLVCAGVQGERSGGENI